MRFNLATRINAVIVGVFAAATISAVVAIFSARQIQILHEQAITENVPSVRAADELELCLLEQRTLLANYVLNGGKAIWIERLHDLEPRFQYWFKLALNIAFTPKEREILSTLDTTYRQYGSKQDEAIRAFDAGQVERAKEIILSELPELYGTGYKLCEELQEENERFVQQATARTREQIRWALMVVGTSIGLTSILSGVLLTMFYRNLLRPLRQMADELRQLPIGSEGDALATHDELRTIGTYLKRLMTDVADTRSTLAQSQFELLHAEKLASVGRLAAGVAHEIRNPLTAMRMWLFSLRRAVGGQADLVQRVDLLSRETNRLEGIVRHFLEFAKPPVLQLEARPVAPIVQNVADLFETMIDDLRIQLAVDVPADLPPILVDAEQLQQVLINLLKNAIEATGQGGSIQISADRAPSESAMLRIRLHNTGSPIPPSDAERIFEPFFTTRSDGSGLGLSIAARILALHGGRVALERSDEQGSTFAIWIPTQPSGAQA